LSSRRLNRPRVLVGLAAAALAEIVLGLAPIEYEPAVPLLVLVAVLLLVDFAFRLRDMSGRDHQPWHRPRWPLEGHFPKKTGEGG